MEMYQDMIEHNKEEDKRFIKWREKHMTSYRSDYNGKPKFSDTMLHDVVKIINRLNNTNP